MRFCFSLDRTLILCSKFNAMQMVSYCVIVVIQAFETGCEEFGATNGGRSGHGQ